jgi:predicted NBD/HSP70 family sugar kinase
LPAAVDAVEEALRRGSVYRDRLLGAGVGLPRPIDRGTGMPSPSNILPGGAGVHIAEELTGRLGVPAAASASRGSAVTADSVPLCAEGVAQTGVCPQWLS